MKYKIMVNGRTIEEIEDMLQQREIFDYCREKKVRLLGIDISKNDTIYRFESHEREKKWK